VNAPPDYNSVQLYKSNLTFCVVCVFNLQLVFLRGMVHSQSTLQRQILKSTLYCVSNEFIFVVIFVVSVCILIFF
jgi:hypothetical protein